MLCFRNRPVATGRAFGGNAPEISMVPPNFVVPKTLFIKTYNKNKNVAPLNMYFAPPNLKTWLRACIEIMTLVWFAR